MFLQFLFPISNKKTEIVQTFGADKSVYDVRGANGEHRIISPCQVRIRPLHIRYYSPCLPPKRLQEHRLHFLL